MACLRPALLLLLLRCAAANQESLLRGALRRDMIGERRAQYVTRSVNRIVDAYVGTRTVVMFTDEVRYSDLGLRLLADMGHARLLVSAADPRPASDGLIVYLQRDETAVSYEPSTATDYDAVLRRLPSSDRSRHMVLWPAVASHDRVDLHRIQVVFETFWHHQLIDVAVLVPMSTGSIRVYAFNPYTGSRCNQAGPPIMINVWSAWLNAFLKPDRVFGLDHKLKDLHKCPLKCLGIHRPPVSTVVRTHKGFSLTGTGLQIIDFMQKHMNFTGVVTVAHGHAGVHFLPENAATAADNDSSPVGDKVKHRKVDLAFGRFTRIFDSESEVEFVKEDQMDCFTWGLPSGIGHDHELWTNYVAEFSAVTWLLIAAGVALGTAAVAALSRSSPPVMGLPPSRWSLSFALFYAYGTFVGAPVRVTPSLESSSSCALRVFLANWLLYGLVVTSAYTAYLGSLITIPRAPAEINDQRALLNTDLHLVGRQQMYYLINSSAGASNDFKELVDRYQILPPEDFGHFIRRILLKRDTAVLASRRELIFYAQRYKKMFNDTRHLHVLPECIIESYSSTFMLRKGSPIRHRISTIMSRLSETGIMQQWDRANVKEELVHGIVFTEDTILSMPQFYGAFIVLFLGLFLGFCAFVGEAVVHRVTMDRPNTKKKLFQFLN